ncbi:turripeptide Lol9.1-like isoform X2 [Dreissena polymorpha]|uniref:turripeptide Lol9.1-like isoform X2 n=1 Tax=Dreissena polymorpha TaxID=45954 RepID=UPI002264E3C2|nr:turripeptide Lol9.1-like isoform X2 [Dreissena polymorpha]
MKVLCAFVAIIGFCFGATIDRRAAAQCAQFCPEYYSPICGSDGQTYGNICFFNAAHCLDHTLTHKQGACGDHPTVSLPVAACPDVMCFALYDPVCGTDGKTYGNSCELTSKYCHGEVTVAHKGSCIGDLVVS